MFHRRTLPIAITATAVVLAASVTTLASATPAHHTTPATTAPTTSAPKPTIVLVNGAWSDSASWSGVVKRLQDAGYPVAAPPTELRSLSGDSAYLASYLRTIQGPIVLVGQSYGGSVITNAATGNGSVRALVYISAFAPDVGESAAALTAKFPGTHITDDPNAPVPTALSPVPFTQADGSTGIDLYANADQYRDVFLSNRLDNADSSELAATQSPVTAAALGDPSGQPAWKTIPSWYLVSDDDHLIPPAAERFMATRAHARTIDADTPHAAQVTNPGIVTSLIEQAATTTR
ncbi:alpha/beta hydrolase [Saccharopolyspora sp. K220]|uniref:alpha/beta fold hydrolase n=1 Tax=Saccharopolyspora soli TaxID=2926618 RepID=UPI001F57E4FD|nr:alpha/beta hydrolase [Saccharopolyspora soli]MCI2422106.1 alpha/beta hydrolase [Saccharopolyspora soli]